jgi:AcrR family transcriptional regulator
MNESPFSQPSIDAPAYLGAPFGTPVPEPSIHPTHPAVPSDLTLLDQSGRPLGPRALKTRSRILDATITLLDEKAMRDLRVIDIARRIGSSPATFYQYFKDIEDVVLELASRIQDLTPAMIEIIQGDWTGRDGHMRGRHLANLFIDHFAKYNSILRVRNNSAEEGSAEFVAVRIQTMLPLLTAFSDLVREAHPIPAPPVIGEWTGGKIYPIMAAMILTTALEGLAVHHDKYAKRFAVDGEGREQMVETMATLLQMLLT